MKQYYSFGGSSDPNFRYRVEVREVTSAMLAWCIEYPATDPDFERYYYSYNDRGIPVFQFETEKPAIIFRLKFE
jgi:hypothetical protein